MEKRRALRCRGTCSLVAAALVAAVGLTAGDTAEAHESDQSPGAAAAAQPTTRSAATPETESAAAQPKNDDSTDEAPAHAKHAVPTLAKEVGEVSGPDTVFGSHADAAAGRAIPYRLVGTLPGDYAKRTAFRYRFTDRLGDDLQLAKDSVSISVQHGSKRRALTGATIALKNRTLTVDWKDLKKADGKLAFGDKIIVEYHASIARDTKRFGQSSAHRNKAVLSYSTDAAGSDIAQTKAARTESYTYRMVLTKLSAHGSTPLAGARFQLANGGKGASADKSRTKTVDTDKRGNAVFTGLDAGTYTLTEIEAPDGYQRLSEPITVEIATNVATMDDQLELTAQAKGPAKVTETDAGSGRISLQVRNDKTGGAQSEPGGTFHKTGNPLIDYAWALLLVAAGAVGLIRYGIAARKRTDAPEAHSLPRPSTRR